MSKSRKQNKIDWLFIIPRDGLLGGAEQVLFELVNHLVDSKHKCQVIFLSKKNRGAWVHLEDKCVIKYSPFGDIYFNYLVLIFRILKIRLTGTISYCFSSQTLINSYVGGLKRLGLLKGTTVIVRESTSIFRRMKGFKLLRYSWAYRIGYKKVDLVICQSDIMKDQLIESMPWMEKSLNVSVLPNPINLQGIIADEEIKDFNQSNFIVAAGRLIPEKGFDLLFEAFKLNLEEFPDLVLLILGEGTERSFLEQQIIDLGLAENAFLLGFISNVYPYFNKAKACVVSSRIEGFPNVLLQMMSQNTKVVSTLCAGGISDIPGLFTCDPENVQDLATEIGRCIKSDTAINRQLFDAHLEQRSVAQYINSVLSHV